MQTLTGETQECYWIERKKRKHNFTLWANDDLFAREPVIQSVQLGELLPRE
jgi:hypothetical protein